MDDLNKHAEQFQRSPAHSEFSGPEPTRPRLTILGAILRIVVAVVIVGAALFGAFSIIQSRPEAVQRTSFERSFTVAVTDADLISFTPSIQSYGEVQAGNTLELRAQAAGEVQYVSPNLRVGANVSAGELLVKIDPFDYELALSNAQVDAEDARLSLTEIQEQQKLQAENVEFARQQYDVAVSDLDRAESLYERGTITSQELESRKLVVSQREQTLAQAQSNLVLQQAALDRGQAAIDRADRAVAQAQRALDATNMVAAFDGTVSATSVTLGAIVGQNETLASLYETDNLEVRFSISEQNFGQIASDTIVGRPVTITWEISGAPRTLDGEIVRLGAEIDPTMGGVELYARVNLTDTSLLRPGTFVSVSLPGETFDQVLLLPETAIYETDHLYVVEDGRMARVDVEILARQGDQIIAKSDVNDGARIITTRLSQAGDGLRVTIEGEESEATGGFGGPPGEGAGGPPSGGAGGPGGGGPNG